MNTLQYWQQKLVQLTHDPLHKTLLLGGGGSHKTAAAQIFQEIADTPLRYANAAPDRIAAGADRPMLGTGAMCTVDWRQHPHMRHPLQPRVGIRVPGGDQLLGTGARARAGELTDALVASWRREEGQSEGEDHGPTASVWTDANALRALAMRVWRRQPTWSRQTGLPARLIPADSRCPDHALLDHVRVAAAACFLPRMTDPTPSPAQEPCLVSIRLHGVQTFIAESRKTRDLWTASLIYGELVWAAMSTVVEQYGPENVLYPDLLGNPFMDQWLLAQQGLADAVPDQVRRYGARTASVPVPNTFTCLLPRGGDGHLLAVDVLMARAEEQVRARWQTMTDATRALLEAKGASGRWTEIWDRSLCNPPALTWTAVAWRPRMRGQGTVPPADLPALPDRGNAATGQLPPVLQARAAALQPWVSEPTWEHYEHLRTVSWRVVALMQQPRPVGDWLGAERGFDYPLVHAQLLALAETTAQARSPEILHEPGEKCSVTGRHEALTTNPAGGVRDVRGARSGASAFWADVHIHHGAERLGAPAALKRFLSMAKEPAFIQRWNGIGQPDPSDKDRTAPYPSTAGLAAGPFLERVARRWPELRAPVLRFLAALRDTKLDEDTQHARALPRLVRYTGMDADPDLRKFLRTEAQTLSLEVLATHRERAEAAKEREEAERIRRLAEAVKALLDIAGDAPDEEVAVLFMDGDGVSRLVEGDAEVIQTRWRDVLHPNAVGRIEDRDSALYAAGWNGLLDQKRALGPSLHAMLTRALADFTDRLAPWVVEVEFPGRLIYAGGDDLLALLPARHAVAAAARLQQLFSAPYVLDTLPDEPRWEWRRAGTDERWGARAAERFRVPKVPIGASGEIDPSNWTFEDTITEEGTQVTQAPTAALREMEVLPMLGRGHALSAGIALGHFKTPLSSLLGTAKANLDERAKRRGRELRKMGAVSGHLSVSRFTGSGAKATFTAPWSLGRPGMEGVDPDPPALQVVMDRLVEGFRTGALAMRLPYQLREAIQQMLPVLRTIPRDELPSSSEASPPSSAERSVMQAAERSGLQKHRQTLLAGLIRATTGLEPEEHDTAAAVLAVLANSLEDARSAHDAVSGLLLARHFSSRYAEGAR